MTQARDLADNKLTGDVEIDGTTLTVDSTNNRVGVGTVSPAVNLHIVDADNNVQIRVENNDGIAKFQKFEDDLIVTNTDTGDIIIKTGTGETERVRVDSSGRVLQGASSAPLKWWNSTVYGNLNLIENNNITNANFYVTQGLVRNSADSEAAQLGFAKSRGTTSGSTTVVQNDDSLGLITFQGADGTNYVEGARISAYCDGTTGADNMPTRLVFSTTADGAATPTERMRLRSDGNIGIGTAGAATVRFYVKDPSNTAYTAYIRNEGASYGGNVLISQTARASSSAFSLATFYSDQDINFNFRGDGYAFADGTWASGGADYAEYFEWDDGNTNNEDRKGYSVVLTNGNKIRKATSSDAAADIIGVISANPSVVGDAGWNKWNEKYLKDDFGSYIWETYTVTEWTEPAVTNEDGEVTQEAVEHSYETDKIPSELTVPSDAIVSSVDANGNTLKRQQLNPSYDDTLTYTPREDRQEWDAVGMMGKLRMRSGQPTGDRWIKMRDIATDNDGNVTVEEWLVR